jgi:hypothetical protein
MHREVRVTRSEEDPAEAIVQGQAGAPLGRRAGEDRPLLVPTRGGVEPEAGGVEERRRDAFAARGGPERVEAGVHAGGHELDEPAFGGVDPTAERHHRQHLGDERRACFCRDLGARRQPGDEVLQRLVVDVRLEVPVHAPVVTTPEERAADRRGRLVDQSGEAGVGPGRGGVGTGRRAGIVTGTRLRPRVVARNRPGAGVPECGCTPIAARLGARAAAGRVTAGSAARRPPARSRVGRGGAGFGVAAAAGNAMECAVE